MIKSIAVLGVDGTGKSTVLSILEKRLGERCRLQYMGYRDFVNPRLEALKKKKNKSAFEKIFLISNVYIEMRKRVGANRDFKGIIVYDRYVDEIYINAGRKSQVLYKLMYKYLFPKPDGLVYLYCNADISLHRKKDIPDKEQFIQMKKRFDQEFMNKSGVLCLNSEELSAEKIAEKIIENYIR